MKIYLRGVILSVGPVELVGQNQMKIQHCVIQHEFNQTEPRYNKYAMFDVIGDRIDQLNLKPQEEVELTIDLNARMGSAGRWFNSLTAFAVERDKKKWHYYENNKQRVAVMPTATVINPAVDAAGTTKTSQAADAPIGDAIGMGPDANGLPY